LEGAGSYLEGAGSYLEGAGSYLEGAGSSSVEDLVGFLKSILDRFWGHWLPTSCTYVRVYWLRRGDFGSFSDGLRHLHLGHD
jgi:hypothetical protein